MGLRKASKANSNDVQRALKSAEKGLPTSNVNHLDKTSTLCLINSEIFLIIFDLSHGDVFLQIVKPFYADLRALWTSLLFAFDAFPITSSVAGLIILWSLDFRWERVFLMF